MDHLHWLHIELHLPVPLATSARELPEDLVLLEISVLKTLSWKFLALSVLTILLIKNPCPQTASLSQRSTSLQREGQALTNLNFATLVITALLALINNSCTSAQEGPIRTRLVNLPAKTALQDIIAKKNKFYPFCALKDTIVRLKQLILRNARLELTVLKWVSNW